MITKAYKKCINHIFPSTVVVFGIIMTAFSIHGWSIGELSYYYGDSTIKNDKALLYGEPLRIRSDEWMVLTPKSIAQYKNHLSNINKNIGSGEDASIIIDAPTKDWASFFMPQNFGYFFLPLDNALAFKWWFLICGLLITVYYFVLRFFSGNKLAAIGLAAFVAYAPLIQWTFRSFIVIPTITILLGLIVGANILKICKLVSWQQVLNMGLLTYLLVVFAIVLYPPFQLSALIVGAVFYIGIATAVVKYKALTLKQVLFRHIPIVISVVAAIGIVGLFYLSHQGPIGTMRSAVFPGIRHFTSGKVMTSIQYENLWAGGVTKMLSNEVVGQQAAYYNDTALGNQSEAAATIWIIVPLIASLFMLVVIQKKGIDPIVYAALGLNIAILIWFIIPSLSLPIIDQIPINRTNLILLLGTFISLGVLLKNEKDLKLFVQKNKKFSVIFSAIWFINLIICLAAIAKINQHYPDVIAKNSLLSVCLFVVFTILIGLRYIRYAMVVLGIMTIVVGINANPLYRGTGSLFEQPLVKKIESLNKTRPGRWIFDGSFYFTALPLITNSPTLTTNFSYMQSYWKEIDPKEEHKQIYNKAGYVIGEMSPITRISALGGSYIKLEINMCDKKLVNKLDIRYVATTSNSSLSDYISPCVQKLATYQTRGMREVTLYEVKR